MSFFVLCMNIAVIISFVIFQYLSYLSNIIIPHEVYLSNILIVPHFRINIRKFCPTVVGKYYWNDFPLSVCSISSKRLFKKALFKYYFAQY